MSYSNFPAETNEVIEAHASKTSIAGISKLVGYRGPWLEASY